MFRLPVWCVIGDVLNPTKAASRVVSHLERHGKTVYCVNPSAKTVETETLKRSLSALPVVPDVVDLIINPTVGAEQMQMAAELGIANVFVQPVRACMELRAQSAVCGSHGLWSHNHPHQFARPLSR
jgi:uncharacterized protein